MVAGTPTPGMTPPPGPTPGPTPMAGLPGGGPATIQPQNPMSGILAKIISLLGGKGPGIIPQHTQALNASLDPEATPSPMPTLSPTPSSTPGAPPLELSHRIGGNELSGHNVGVLGSDKGFSKTASAKGGVRIKGPAKKSEAKA